MKDFIKEIAYPNYPLTLEEGEEKLKHIILGGAIILLSIWIFPINLILVLILFLIFQKKDT